MDLINFRNFIRVTEGYGLASLPAALVAVLTLTGACGKALNTSSLNDDSGYTSRNASAAEGQEISVGAFNMLRLGHGEKNFQRLAKVIDKAGYDVFAGLEVMTAEGANQLLEALRAETNIDWRLMLSASANGEGTYKEYNAFYYRAEAVEADIPTRAFCKTSEGVERTESACYARDNGGEYITFERDPFVGHFKVHGVPVTLISVHLIYGDSVERRQDEALSLREVMDDVRSKTPGSHVMAVGDFNLTVVHDDDAPEPEHSRYLEQSIPEEVFASGPKVDGLFDGPTTLGESSYDHILYYEELREALVPRSAKVVEDINVDDADQRALFKAEVSDHYAIRARFRIH